MQQIHGRSRAHHQMKVVCFLDAGLGVPRMTALALLFKCPIAWTAQPLDWLLL
jgi:hypothetical protein